jgi:hypothetical protein
LSRPGAIQFPGDGNRAIAHVPAARLAIGGDFMQST